MRQVNEDRAWSGQIAGGWTAVIVADGMGGHRAGDVASELAVGCLSDALQFWDGAVSQDEGSSRLKELILKANAVVYETASLNEKYHNMGTTVVAAVMNDRGGWIGHIGDSRAYRLRGGVLEQLTDDHTLVNELAKSGQLSPEEAAQHPRRNVLTRALGTERDIKPDMLTFEWRPGDRMLLCSDGLSNMVDPSTLRATLEQPGATLDEIADRLVELALDAGGDDNVTVVLVEADETAAAGGESA